MHFIAKQQPKTNKPIALISAQIDSALSARIKLAKPISYYGKLGKTFS